MRLLLTSLILLTLAAQGQSNFVPVVKLPPPPYGLVGEIKQQSAAEWSSMTLPKEADKEYARLAYKKELDNLVAKIEDHHIMAESEVTEYLQSLADKVKEANGIHNDNIRVFAYRSDVPNAASMGTGVVAMMLGLLPRLETEDQLAFVLCHELAHVVAAHNIRSIYQEATAFNAAEKQISKASRKQYNRYSSVAGLLENFEKGYKQHSRAFEYEADSIALQMFIKAGFDPQQALRTMDILDTADEDPYPPLDLRDYFNVTAPANASIYSEVAQLHKLNTRPDSLSTHPNVDLRKAALSRQLSRMNIEPKSVAPKANPVALAASLELVNGEFLLQNLGTSLYHSIHLSARYPNAYYLTAMVGLNLYEIYTRQKAHTLGTSVAQPDPRFAKSYNDVIVRVHRLRLKELGDATYQFMISRPEKAFADEHFLFALWKVSMLPGSQLDPESVKSDYLNQYPSGIYSKPISIK
jgi:Zn-dependent protease with chaperone function